MNAVQEFAGQFTQKEVDDVVQIGREFFQIRPDLKAAMEKIDSSINREASYAGTFLGTLKGRKFEPSIALIDIIAPDTEKKIIIDDKAEWLFLCGRDIFGKSVKRTDTDRGLAIVLNQKEEVLGYGRITGRMTDMEDVFLKNLLDRGDFLRREMKRR